MRRRSPFAALVLASLLTVACRPPAPAPPDPALAAAAAAETGPPIELVESTPIETTLDHPDIPDAADVWLAMIQGANDSIDLAEFYASNQIPSRLEPIVAALESAIRRGVRVRFLAERKFVKTYPETLDRLASAGAQVRHYDLSKAGGGILHAKYFIVDDREAFLGSQNFDWRALEHIYELGARIREPAAVAGLAAIFAADWAKNGGEAAPPRAVVSAAGPITLVASPEAMLPAGVPWDLPRLVKLLDGATRSIELQLLSYRASNDGAPWDTLEAPIRRAAARGVAVSLLLADWSKRPKSLLGLQQLARVPNIAIRLTTIPQWSGGFVPFARVSHAKTLVIDGARGWLGTSNWEASYFTDSRNVGVIVDDAAVAATLGRFFATLWNSPYAVPLDPDASYTPPRIE